MLVLVAQVWTKWFINDPKLKQWELTGCRSYEDLVHEIRNTYGWDVAIQRTALSLPEFTMLAKEI